MNPSAFPFSPSKEQGNAGSFNVFSQQSSQITPSNGFGQSAFGASGFGTSSPFGSSSSSTFGNPFAPSNSSSLSFGSSNGFASAGTFPSEATSNPFGQSAFQRDISVPKKPSEEQSQKVCFYFNSKGGCLKGDTCPFLHQISSESNGDRKRMCTFFQQGRCNKGEDCPFAHASPSEPTQPFLSDSQDTQWKLVFRVPEDRYRSVFIKKLRSLGEFSFHGKKRKDQIVVLYSDKKTADKVFQEGVPHKAGNIKPINPPKPFFQSTSSEDVSVSSPEKLSTKSNQRLDSSDLPQQTVKFVENLKTTSKPKFGKILSAAGLSTPSFVEKVKTASKPKFGKILSAAVLSTPSSSSNGNSSQPTSKLTNIISPASKEKIANRGKRFQSFNAPDNSSIPPTDTPNAQNSQVSLSDGFEELIGTCMTMCPPDEIQLRQTTKELHYFEMKEGTQSSDMPLADPSKCVKKYSRSDAGKSQAAPHEVRPPQVLVQSMNYLLQCLDAPKDLTSIYGFLRDRFRAVRQDLKFQDEFSPVAVEMLEQMVRFHILMRFALFSSPREYFDPTQNNSLLMDCLDMLKTCYQRQRNLGKTCPNEQEMLSYQMLSSLGDKLAASLHFSQITLNLSIHRQIMESYMSHNFVRFFKLMAETTVLQKCVLFSFTQDIRILAARSIFVSYSQFPLTKFKKLLRFKSLENTKAFLDVLSFSYENEYDLNNCVLLCGAANSNGSFEIPQDSAALLKPYALDFTLLSQPLPQLSSLVRGEPSLNISSYVPSHTHSPLNTARFRKTFVPQTPQSFPITQSMTPKATSITVPENPTIQSPFSSKTFVPAIVPKISPEEQQQRISSLESKSDQLLNRRHKNLISQSILVWKEWSQAQIAQRHRDLSSKSEAIQQKHAVSSLSAALGQLQNLSKARITSLQAKLDKFMQTSSISLWHRVLCRENGKKAVEQSLRKALSDPVPQFTLTNVTKNIPKPEALELTRILEIVSPILLAKNQSDNIFLPILVSVEDPVVGVGNWIRKQFSFQQPMSRHISFICSAQVHSQNSNTAKTVFLSFTEPAENSKGQQGVLFVCSTDHEKNQQRLRSLAQTLPCRIPLCILFRDKNQHLSIPSESFTSVFRYPLLTQSTFSVSSLYSCITSIAQHIPSQPVLYAYESFDLFSVPVSSIQTVKHLNCLIDAFNDLVNKLAHVFNNSQIQAINWPPSSFEHSALPPFNWNSPSNLASLNNIFMDCKLTPINSSGLETTTPLSNVIFVFQGFIQECFKHGERPQLPSQWTSSVVLDFALEPSSILKMCIGLIERVISAKASFLQNAVVEHFDSSELFCLEANLHYSMEEYFIMQFSQHVARYNQSTMSEVTPPSYLSRKLDDILQNDGERRQRAKKRKTQHYPASPGNIEEKAQILENRLNALENDPFFKSMSRLLPST